MNPRLRLLLVTILLIAFTPSFSQMTGANVFLQGTFTEVGIAPNGSWGAGPCPAGYHPRGSGAAAGTNLAMTYDYGHDGWTVGTPAFYGDYVYPGTPYEGWALQVNGARSDAYYTLFTTASVWFWDQSPGISSLSGGNTSYSNTGGVLTGVWQGTTTGSSGGLSIRQTTRVEQNASWAVVTTEFTNTTGAPIPDVYYWRNCDPDNEQVLGGLFGSFATVNRIVHQNDVDHRVMVNSRGNANPNAYLALATKDCRAKAMIFEDWEGSSLQGYPDRVPGNSLDRIYNQTATALGNTWYTGAAPLSDIGIGLIYNIGTIAPGATAVISYAYIFSNDAAIDSAFPEPTLVVNGISQPPSGPAPAPTYDTFDACASTLTTLPVRIDFASDKCWTNSTWTWAPATGLASTTGVTNTVNLTTIPSVITYTITGTDSATGMLSCANRVMYLTVRACTNTITACYGDSLKFNLAGDSTAATYAWYGPAPSTAVINTNQSFFRFPATWTDTGTYHVIKTVAGVPDTVTFTITLNPKPNVTASSNSPLCIGAVDTLELFSTTTVTPVTFSWTGPGAFTSGLQNPTRPNFALGDTGIYRVIVTTQYGCKDTATAHAVMLPPPGPPLITTDTSYCVGEAAVPFNIVATGVVYWYSSAAGAGSTTTAPVVSTAAAGTFTYYFNQTIGQCVSPIDSITIFVNQGPIASFNAPVDFGCTGDVVTTEDHSSGADTYLWDFGGGATATTQVASHTYPRTNDGGIFTILLTVHSTNGCVDTQTVKVDTRHSVVADFTTSRDTFCAVNPTDQITMINNSSASVTGTAVPTSMLTYQWTYANGNTDATEPGGAAQSYAVAGTYTLELIVTDTIGCKATAYRDVVSLRVDINAFDDSTLCLKKPMLMLNNVTVYPPVSDAYWTYAWTESSPNLSDLNIQHPYLSGFGTFVDELTATIEPGKWGCFASKTMTVNSISGKLLTNVTLNTTIAIGSTLQMNADNEIYYHWVPNDGSIDNPNINNPIVAPTQTTVYTVYGMDEYGCVDSAFVTVIVDSTLSEGLPSAFTPNGDGLNDVFRVIGLKYQRLVEFRIFNRWGEQVFYTRDAKDGWDGTFNGVPQDLGVYHYHVIVAHPEGKNVVYKGDVTLIR